jgi:hypothetical protein
MLSNELEEMWKEMIVANGASLTVDGVTLIHWIRSSPNE